MAYEDIVLVMNRNEPDAVLVGLNSPKIIGMPGVRSALATALFKDGNLSLPVPPNWPTCLWPVLLHTSRALASLSSIKRQTRLRATWIP